MELSTPFYGHVCSHPNSVIVYQRTLESFKYNLPPRWVLIDTSFSANVFGHATQLTLCNPELDSLLSNGAVGAGGTFL